MSRRGWASTGALLMVCSGLAWSQGAIDVYAFDNDAQEARYKTLIAEFRCPKCLNTNLAGSDAPIAADLRREVHRLVLQGKSDVEISAHLQARYGDFVLYDPPVRADTLLLWALPLLLFVIGVWAITRIARSTPSEALEPADQERLAQLLAEAHEQEPSGQ